MARVPFRSVFRSFLLVSSALAALAAPRVLAQDALSAAAAPATAEQVPAAQAQSDVSAPSSGQSSGVPAQQWDANALDGLEQSLKDHAAISPPDVRPQDLKTLFFTAWQYALLYEAKNLFDHTRPPDAGEASDPGAPKPAGPREIALGGISFVNGDNWTVWLNSQRVKPDAIPKEIMDIKVRKDHIDLKWYDVSTNLIYPVRLRPHQRFNLDTRIFLPGTGT